MLNVDKLNIGSRWDGPELDNTINIAIQHELIDYLEIATPQCQSEPPIYHELPLLAHSTENPIASAYGLNPAIYNLVKKCADYYQSPWVGEHLCLLAPERTGALGYIINPIFTKEFMEIACDNVKLLQDTYQRPVAIELGPLYNFIGDYHDEIAFINDIAHKADCYLLFDISHFTVSNRNLNRADNYGYDTIDFERVIEIHITGIKKSQSFPVWHDDHNHVPDSDVLSLLSQIIPKLSNLKAITLELNRQENINDYLDSLKSIHKIVEKSISYEH